MEFFSEPTLLEQTKIWFRLHNYPIRWTLKIYSLNDSLIVNKDLELDVEK